MMQVTITYKQSEQIGPEDYEVWTEVTHVEETATMKDVFERLRRKFPHGNLTVELHFNEDADRVVSAEEK